MNCRQTDTLAVVVTIVLVSSGLAAAFSNDPTGDKVLPSLSVDDLRCEYLINPVGIDARAPRLSWKLRAVRPEARALAQSAFQIVVASTEALLREDKGTLWDTRQDRVVPVPACGVWRQRVGVARRLLVEGAGLGSGRKRLRLEHAGAVDHGPAGCQGLVGAGSAGTAGMRPLAARTTADCQRECCAASSGSPKRSDGPLPRSAASAFSTST